MGNTVIACAAVDDVTAWCILAFVVVLARSGDATELMIQLALVALYVRRMIFVVRPLLRKLAPARRSRRPLLAAVLFLVLVSAWTTEILGIHALFGAFLAGAIMPREAALNEALIPHIRGLDQRHLPPPLLRRHRPAHQPRPSHTPELWLCCASSSSSPSPAIRRRHAQRRRRRPPLARSHRHRLLMNTRGLMEMVVLNIGLESASSPPACSR